MRSRLRTLLPIVLASLTLLVLALPAQARMRMYDPQMGGFLQRDPGYQPRGGMQGFVPRAGQGYQDGMNLYVGHFAQHSALDPSGLFKVELSLEAFIPKSKGKRVNGVPGLNGVNWAEEPGQVLGWFSDHVSFFNTDNREKASENGSSKIKTLISFDTDNIFKKDFGEGDITHSVVMGTSHQIQIDNDGRGNYVANSLRSQKGPHDGEITGVWNNSKARAEAGLEDNATQAIIQGGMWGKYPFGNAPTRLTPAIDMSYSIWVRCVAGDPNKIKMFVRGKRDAFPAYGVIVQGDVAYEWYPKAEGPGPVNLNQAYEYKTGWMYVDENGISEVPEE